MAAQSEKPLCFVISPIDSPGSIIRRHADMVLNAIIKSALPSYNVQRGDEDGAPDMITDKIIAAILDAPLAVADLSFLNSNVFYELGLRHMTEKPVIIIASRDTKIPFDTHGASTIFYQIDDWQDQQATKSAIAAAEKATQAKGYVSSTPVTQARGHQLLRQSADSKDLMLNDLLTRVKLLEAEAKKRELRAAILGNSLLTPKRGMIGQVGLAALAKAASEQKNTPDSEVVTADETSLFNSESLTPSKSK